MSTGALVAVIVLGAALLAVGINVVVFRLVRRSVDRAAAELAGEGIVLDSGSVRVTTRYRDFRAAGVYTSHGIRTGPGRLVLTKQRLVVLPRGRRGVGPLDREGLSRFVVSIDDGRLHLASDAPPNASGHIELHVTVADPAAWVAKLEAAGARRS